MDDIHKAGQSVAVLNMSGIPSKAEPLMIWQSQQTMSFVLRCRSHLAPQKWWAVSSGDLRPQRFFKAWFHPLIDLLRRNFNSLWTIIGRVLTSLRRNYAHIGRNREPCISWKSDIISSWIITSCSMWPAKYSFNGRKWVD